MKIKFSHTYTKLLDHNANPIAIAKLLLVLEINLEEMSKDFLAYDTDDGLFDLPKKGAYLMLVFQKLNGFNLFTTLRRFTPEKFNYYHAAIGQTFDIEYKPEKDAQNTAERPELRTTAALRSHSSMPEGTA